MCAAVLALEAHNDKILKVGDARLAHLHLSGQLAGMTGDIEYYRLLLHEVIFLKGFGEIYFGTDSFGFDLFDLLLGVLLVVAHGDEFFESSFRVGDF